MTETGYKYPQTHFLPDQMTETDYKYCLPDHKVGIDDFVRQTQLTNTNAFQDSVASELVHNQGRVSVAGLLQLVGDDAPVCTIRCNTMQYNVIPEMEGTPPEMEAKAQEAPDFKEAEAEAEAEAFLLREGGSRRRMRCQLCASSPPWPFVLSPRKQCFQYENRRLNLPC